MIYLNSRPVSKRPIRNPIRRRFEWRDFMDDTQESVDLIRERFEFEGDDVRTEKFFLLPGRQDQITKLNNDETFEIKTLVEEAGPLELWETTIKSEVPMRRTLAKTIASRIPKFSGPVVSAMTPEELTEGLKTKSRYFRVKRKREIFKRGDVTARITREKIDEDHALSIAFESPWAEPLLNELKALGLGVRKNTNFGRFLLHQA